MKTHEKLEYLYQRYRSKNIGKTLCYANLAHYLSTKVYLNKKWSLNYIQSVRSGSIKPSKKLIKAIDLEYKRVKGIPIKKRYRRIFEALSKEQFDEWSILTVEDGRKALDKAVKEMS